MSEEDGFNSIFTATLKNGGSMSMSFPVPPELQSFTLSHENIERSIEYYLLARYAYLHKMYPAFMINSFWAVEHMILSILIFEISEKEELKKIGGYHSITTFWKKAKGILTESRVQQMSKFDDYIGKVQGYFSERYPSPPEQVKLKYTEKIPRITPGAEKKTVKFDKVAHLSLEELDHFINFMLHDITVYSNGSSDNLMVRLSSKNNTELYREENKYSIIYPNKQYQGEQA